MSDDLPELEEDSAAGAEEGVALALSGGGYRAMMDRLMNWGYAICDAAMRAHIDAGLQAKLGIRIVETDTFPFAGGY